MQTTIFRMKFPGNQRALLMPATAGGYTIVAATAGAFPLYEEKLPTCFSKWVKIGENIPDLDLHDFRDEFRRGATKLVAVAEINLENRHDKCRFSIKYGDAAESADRRMLGREGLRVVLF